MAMGVCDFSHCLSSYFLGPSMPPLTCLLLLQLQYRVMYLLHVIFFLQPQFFLQSMSFRTFQSPFIGNLYNSSSLFLFCSPNILKPDLGRSTSQMFFYCPTTLAVAMSSGLVIPLACSRWQLSVLPY